MAWRKLSILWARGTCHGPLLSSSRIADVRSTGTVTNEYNYFDNGQVSMKTRGNGMRTYFDYDIVGQVRSIKHRTLVPNGEVEQQTLNYLYDVSGRLTSIDNTLVQPDTSHKHWNITYGYDGLNRLVHESRIGSPDASFNLDALYSLDGNGMSVTRNGKLSTYNVDGADRFTWGDGFSLGNYSANGNPQAATNGNGVTLYLTYDPENQLTKITYSNGAPANTFLYNGDNQRIQKFDSTGTTNFVYDGSTIACETNLSGATLAWYTPGVGFRRSGVSGFNRENGIGSTLEVTNTTGGTVDRFEYDAYGITYTLQQNLFTPHKFAGKHGYYTDNDSGMELLGHRYYLPMLGRFLTQDPLGHGAGLNLYQYANQNPLVNIDPDGTDTTAVESSNRITITTRIGFSGSRATPAKMREIANVITSTWNRGFRYNGKQVVFKIVYKLNGTNANGYDEIALVPGGGTSETWQFSSYEADNTFDAWPHEPRSGRWYVEDGSEQSWAHEYGHLIGFRDQENDGPNSKMTGSIMNHAEPRYGTGPVTQYMIRAWINRFRGTKSFPTKK